MKLSRLIGGGARSKPASPAPATGDTPDAMEEDRAQWQHTNAARDYLTALATVDEKGRLDISRLDWAVHYPDAGATLTPRRVVQFWDRNPPEEIRLLFAQVAKVCAETGYAHEVYDLDGARERILAAAGPAWAAHYDNAFHPAMQADIFRMVEIYHHGGVYVDADMTLTRPIPFAPPPLPLFAQWAEGSRTNVANWFLCSPPGDPAFAAILRRMERRLGKAQREPDGRFRKAGLLTLTGPVVASRALEAYLARRPGERPVAVMPVSWCHSFVEPARRFLPEPPQYKRAGMHWRREEET